jgi:hypothetical protein
MFSRLASAALLWRVSSNIARKVRRHGWTGMYVGDYATAPTWAYTIGFDETLDQPEIIVFDAPRRSASALFWRTFEALRSGSLVLEDGAARLDDAGQGAVWRKVHPSHIDCAEGWLAFAQHRRAKVTGKPFGLEAFQYVLPDQDGRMPWDAGYDESLRPLQPALYLPRQDGAARLRP